MYDYILYYTLPNGRHGSLPFAIGDEYDGPDEFVKEFLFDHPEYQIDDVKEAW